MKTKVRCENHRPHGIGDGNCGDCQEPVDMCPDCGESEHTCELKVFDIRESDGHYWDEVEKQQAAGNDAYDEVLLVRAYSKDEIVKAVKSHAELLEAARVAYEYFNKLANTPDAEGFAVAPDSITRVVLRKLNQAIKAAEGGK